MRNAWRFLFVLLLPAVLAWAEDSKTLADKTVSVIPDITNIDQLVHDLKLKEFKSKKFIRKIKVAVLDNGFSGYETEIGKSLPKDTVYHKGKASDADKVTDVSYHGLFMAKLLAQLITKSGADADYE